VDDTVCYLFPIIVIFICSGKATSKAEKNKDSKFEKLSHICLIGYILEVLYLNTSKGLINVN